MNVITIFQHSKNQVNLPHGSNSKETTTASIRQKPESLEPEQGPKSSRDRICLRAVRQSSF
uniref:Uncharacterized protein n=1 Tax=Manihot esculenta TaxID=3983 RepID=A0A2C9U6V3_MANES